jgi:RNA pseudouridylate synthase
MSLGSRRYTASVIYNAPPPAFYFALFGSLFLFLFFVFKAVNRLDRLTSGLMILGLSSQRASDLSREFRDGVIKKEYVARCRGKFPAYVCELPPPPFIDFSTHSYYVARKLFVMNLY